jgi:hypothetical protein
MKQLTERIIKLEEKISRWLNGKSNISFKVFSDNSRC